MQEDVRHPGLGCHIAILSTALAALLRYAGLDLMGEASPATIIFIFPVILSAWYSGLWPGLLATALGCWAGNYLYLGPPFSSEIASMGEAVALGLFVVSGVTISGLCEALHVSRRRAQNEVRRALQEAAERQRAEERLRRSEERFRASQEASIFGVAILKAIREPSGDIADFEWEYANPTAATILKRPVSELVGRRSLDVFPSNRKIADLFERYVRVVQTGEPHDFEMRYQGDGIDGWFRIMAVQLGDGVAVSFADITERRRQEEELRESEARFRQLAEAMPHIVWVADASGQNRYFNRQWTEFTGRPLAEGLTERWSESVHPDDVALVRARWATSLKEGTPFTTEYRLRGKDGEYRWHVVRGLPIKGENGQVLCWYGSSTDIDEPKRLAEALKEADRRKDEFLATLSHELRGPLAPIRNAVQILNLRGPSEPILQSAKEVIDRQVAKMAVLIDDLLDINRITHGKLELRPARVKLASVLHHAMETARPYAELAGHELAVQLPAEPIYLNADAIRLTQVFSNLLTNAYKYTDKGGRISLTAVRENGEVVVVVKDNGIGIAPEFLPSVFERFAQEQSALERSQGGLGIGLALVKGLVELHGGTVSAQSPGLGKGSEFVVRLPALSEEGDLLTPHCASSKSNDRSGIAHRILIVDDDEDGAVSLAALLRLGGNEVQTARDGWEAIAAAERFCPDVVLMDLGMPKLNGLDACRRIREQAWGRDMMVVALTSWGTEADRQRTAAAGFDAHLVKPVEHATLDRILNRLETEPL